MAKRAVTPEFPNKFGKQREPMLRLTGPARAFPAASYTGTYTQLTGVNSNKLRLVTSTPNDFSASFSVSLNFLGNYTQTTPPNPYNNPTSTTYTTSATLAIAATHLDIASIGTGNPTVITTTKPHGLGTVGQTRTVWPTGLSGNFSASINAGITATVTGPDTFTVPITTSRVFQVASISIGSPCTVTTTTPHGLSAGTTTGVTINGVVGGTFAGTINATNLSVVSTGPNTFTVTGVNCTAVPTSYTTWREVSNPCVVTTVVPHGLSDGSSVTISGVSGGSFTPTINGTFPVTVVDPSSFTIASSCAVASSANTGSIVGGNTLDVNATGMVNVTYTQNAGSSIMTVNTGGPQTDVVIPAANSGTTTLKSKVYLGVLTRNASLALTSMAATNPVTITKAGHGLATGNTIAISGVTGGTFISGGVTSLNVINKTHTVTVLDADTFTVPAQCTASPTAAGTATGAFGPVATDGVYEVQSATGTTSFTVATADVPTATRTGNVLMPKVSTSYTPQTSNTIVQFNTNVNHSMLVGQNVWVDVPVVTTPLSDGEYTITNTADDDHFKTSYLPVSSALGTYPKPSGSNNGVTLYPLAPAPTGRSGVVTINQSTFNVGNTEGSLTQSPLNAPTVFNYFLPDYKFPGDLSNQGLDSPEFQLTTDTNVMNLTNSLTNVFIGTGGGNGNLNGLSSFNNGSGSVVMSIQPFLVPAKTSNVGIPALIDELAALLVGGPLVAETKTQIQNFVANTTYFPYTTPTPTNQQMRDRVRAIIHLIVTSAEYAVQK